MNLDTLYPVGAVLYAMADLNPEAFYGGRWQRVKGRCLVMLSEGDADFGAPGQTGGSKAHALALRELPAHAHAFTGSPVEAETGGAHTHTLYAKTSAGAGALNTLGSNNNWGDFLDTVSHTHTLAFAGSVSNTGGGAGHENRQPYLTCFIWYRVS